MKNKKLFLFDIDGTLAIENTLYEGSFELIDKIRRSGGVACFITNNSTKSNADYVEKFAGWNIETTEELFVTAGFLTEQFLKEKHADDLIFVCGTKSYVESLKKQGLHITEDAEEKAACVLVAFDSEITYDKLTKACELLSTKEIPFYGTNPDLVCPAKFGFIPDCGSLCQMVTNATKKEPVYIGKPNPEVVEICRKRFGFSKEETIVVGDRLYTDIACGINAGVDTCAVLTGETTMEEIAESIWKPTYVFQNVKELLKEWDRNLSPVPLVFCDRNG